MRVVVTLLSLVLLRALGGLGEEFINLLHEFCGSAGDEGLPAPSSFVYNNYDLNAGHFVLSLTPAAILLVGNLVLSWPRGNSHRSFLYGFLTIWLLTAIYFGWFAYAVILPHHILLKIVGTQSPVPRLAYTIDAILGVVLICLCAGAVWRCRRAARVPREDG